MKKINEDLIYQKLNNKKISLFFKRLFDILISLLVIILILIPVGIIALAIKLDSKGPVFYRQERLGKDKKPFYIIKFRTMMVGADKNLDNLTVKNDPRITRVGGFLRKWKIDELPQFFNVLAGDMSLVGPRPETPKMVGLYDNYYDVIFAVRPGITDYASIEFRNESDYYNSIEASEKIYLEKILPIKIDLKLKYIENLSIKNDILILLNTAKTIITE
ncbi:sugar transferase [Anaerococcus sp. NML200574]|uniref:Sugar transferase n=1 Tax=Anaerococcus kampingae TaxID=3115614 RepID=A0ABW9MAE4_9FIRM|nr:MULTISPECIES: sugar transferase [unclassified Anaerococcus]MCW6678782.1 sugar transferase [Anaerococcus sp. NML200574]MCW6701000.1 sugar transferase [Anaerococcus sp. NML200537]